MKMKAKSVILEKYTDTLTVVDTTNSLCLNR